MTYNFDPDKWLDDEIYLLKEKLKNTQMTAAEFDSQLEALEKKHEEMWRRLDGTYRIP